MKTTMLTLLTILCASVAFAGTTSLTAGTVYSVGSTTASPFKTSPKVTLVVVTSTTAWSASANHASCLGNAKGIEYATKHDDPGMYRKACGTTATSVESETAIPNGYTAEN